MMTNVTLRKSLYIIKYQNLISIQLNNTFYDDNLFDLT